MVFKRLLVGQQIHIRYEIEPLLRFASNCWRVFLFYPKRDYFGNIDSASYSFFKTILRPTRNAPIATNNKYDLYAIPFDVNGET